MNTCETTASMLVTMHTTNL